MKSGTALAHRPVRMPVTDVRGTLESARHQVEMRFLDGSAVLVSVMEGVGQLLASLDRLTKSLDGDGAGDTTCDLMQTAHELLDLPEFESRRQENFAVLSAAGAVLSAHVVDMQETMRYLRTFAITVKITGAGIAEFGGFAQEILERIQSGTNEVNGFAEQLTVLERDLKLAMNVGASAAKGYGQAIPKVIGALETHARLIARHRRELGEKAAQDGAIARGVQDKVAATLSALQIGDITRERIEHMQSAFTFLEEFFASDEGRALDGSVRDRIENLIYHLTAAQMRSMVEDFQRESRNIVQTITSFVQDTQDIQKLRDEMKGDDTGGNFLRTLEDSVSTALAIVKQVETARLQASRISRSTLDTTSTLLKSVANIRAVKTDIHYMALNTNLRCSRMGEEGRSINVITAELRIFAAKLDDSADGLVAGLADLEAAGNGVASSHEADARRLDERLGDAVGAIRAGANRMDSELAIFSEHGRDVASKLSLSLSKLDFQNDIGEILAACAETLSKIAGPELPDVADLGESLAPLAARIMKTYTMAQERTVHHDVMPVDCGPVLHIVETAPASDEDLFKDARF
ncbi:MAG: chemotaxis protein [Rhizobium sp.]